MCVLVRRGRRKVRNRSGIIKHGRLRGDVEVPGAFWGPAPEADDGVGWSLGGLEGGTLFGMIEVGAAGVGFVDLDDIEGFSDVHGGDWRGGGGAEMETILGIGVIHLHDFDLSKSTR